MNTLTAFFAFRRVFTVAGLRAIWFAVLLYELAVLLQLAWGTYAAHGSQTATVWPSLLPLLLQPLLYLVLVRVLLEVAAVILAGGRFR